MNWFLQNLGQRLHFVFRKPFAACLRAPESFFKTTEIQSADLYAKKILVQYAVVRAIAPVCIVETGVANGVSSSCL